MQAWMLKAFSLAPHVVERMLRVFPLDRLDDRIERDRYTAREVIAHLADYEQFVLEAFRMAKLRPGGTIENYDPDQRAKDHHFAEKDVYREAEVFESRRLMTVEFLQSYTEEDWTKTVTTPSGRSITAHEFFTAILAHDMEHVDQLSAYLATEVATIS